MDGIGPVVIVSRPHARLTAAAPDGGRAGRGCVALGRRDDPAIGPIVIGPLDLLRRRRLRAALVGYPVYDPPHRREERLLPRGQAIENLDHFLAVRLHRLTRFQDWLAAHFGVRLTLDREGVVALNRWGDKYAGFLLNLNDRGRPTDAYFTYSPMWEGEEAGCNVVLDIGVAFGEAVIAACPKLHWAVDPTWELLPRQSAALRKEPGNSHQRPELTGCENPAWSQPALHDGFSFAAAMLLPANRSTSWFRDDGPFPTANRDQLINKYDSNVLAYPSGDPDGLLNKMSEKDYVRLIDAQNFKAGGLR